jgi:hypothetical protein
MGCMAWRGGFTVLAATIAGLGDQEPGSDDALVGRVQQYVHLLGTRFVEVASATPDGCPGA